MAADHSREGHRYEIRGLLGQGGMGRVERVWDNLRREYVARKRILRPDPGSQLRFKREFRVIASHAHPNLVRLFELGEDDEGLYFTMEHVAGWDLLAYCRDPAGEVPSTNPERSSDGACLRETHAAAPPDPASDPTLAAPELCPSSGATLPCHGDPPPTAPDQGTVTRIAHTLPQILEALLFLHERGIVHRDLKPSNIRVTAEGLVKLLDFGILAELGKPEPDADRSAVLGTPGYMAPEQAEGRALPSSDLYALGAVLVEILTGRPAFQGRTPYDVLIRQLEASAPDLDFLAGAVPEAVHGALKALLRREPERRPGLVAVARALLPALRARPLRLPAPYAVRGPLLGREAEQRTLGRLAATVAASPFRALVLEGPSGVGKTALAEWAAGVAQAEGCTVLRGYGRRTERVPFNALDAAIDDLAGALGKRRATRGDPLFRARLQAAELFSVLAQSATGSPPSGGRLAAFGALTELLCATAAGGAGVLLLVDDLQWADEDSTALLAHLATEAPPGVTVLATRRTDVGPSPADRLLALHTVLGLAVDPLPEEAIVSILLQDRPGDPEAKAAPPTATVETVAARCAGRPALAELARRALHGAEPAALQHPEATLADSVNAKPGAARRLLACLLAADGWLRLGDLAHLAAVHPGEALDQVQELASEGFLRVSGASGEDERADLFHDMVRTLLGASLAPGEVRTAHAALAEWYDGRPETPPEQVVRHLLGAGDVAAAAARAAGAATHAEQRRAFALAAEMYELALTAPEAPRDALLRARAQALENGGAYVAAAACWQEMTALQEACGEAEAAVDAQLREAAALLAANEVSRGHALLSAALARTGERARHPVADLFAAVMFLRGPPRRPQPHRAPDHRVNVEVRSRAEHLVRVGMLLGLVDPLPGIRFLRKARRRLAEANDLERVAWCDCVFAYFAHNGTRAAGPVPLAERYLTNARALLSRVPSPDPLVAAVPLFVEAVAAQRTGRFSESRAQLDDVLDRFTTAGAAGTFEHLYMHVHLALSDLGGQDLPRLADSLRRFREAADRAGDSAIRTHLGLCECYGHFLHGRLEESREVLAECLGALPEDVVTIQRLQVEVAAELVSIHLTDGRRARVAMADALRRGRRYRPAHLIISGLIYGAAALLEANALRSGDPGASAGRVRRYARIALDSPPLCPTWAHRALAYAADAAGRPERALRHLRDAEDEAGRWEQRIDLAITRFQIGLRLGGDEGRGLEGEARALIRQAGSSERLLCEDAGRR